MNTTKSEQLTAQPLDNNIWEVYLNNEPLVKLYPKDDDTFADMERRANDFIDGYKKRERTSEAHGEVSPLEGIVSDNRRWKDVDKALPEDDSEKLCKQELGGGYEPVYMVCHFQDGKWYDHKGDEAIYKFTHWKNIV